MLEIYRRSLLWSCPWPFLTAFMAAGLLSPAELLSLSQIRSYPSGWQRSLGRTLITVQR